MTGTEAPGGLNANALDLMGGMPVSIRAANPVLNSRIPRRGFSSFGRARHVPVR